MKALFVSDVHNGAATPRATEAFLQFVGSVAKRADTLYILGDLFDAWLGDDDLRPPHHAVIDALGKLADAGTKTFAVHGNHDFLLGQQFAHSANVELLPEISTVMLGPHKTVLCHGDELCTDDVEYQAFRSYARAPGNQQAFLSLDMPARIQQARKLRTQSKQAMQLKADDIMDANVQAVHAMLETHAADWMIHGHTHRPLEHVHDIAGRPCQRFVLGDWYEQESVLLWNDETLSRRSIAEIDALL